MADPDGVSGFCSQVGDGKDFQESLQVTPQILGSWGGGHYPMWVHKWPETPGELSEVGQDDDQNMGMENDSTTMCLPPPWGYRIHVVTTGVG